MAQSVSDDFDYALIDHVGSNAAVPTATAPARQPSASNAAPLASAVTHMEGTCSAAPGCSAAPFGGEEKAGKPRDERRGLLSPQGDEPDGSNATAPRKQVGRPAPAL